MRAPGSSLSAVVWRKSSYSNQDGGECVEIAFHVPMAISVRDSKHADGATVTMGAGPWSSFIAGLRAGQL